MGRRGFLGASSVLIIDAGGFVIIYYSKHKAQDSDAFKMLNKHFVTLKAFIYV